MRSSLEKHRDIARSILPSKHRSVSRTELDRARRKTRRKVRNQLRDLTGQVSGNHDAWLDHLGDPNVTNDAEITQLVWRRRGSDKLNHFQRWAVMRTRDLPLQDRMPFVRSTLPDGLIGRHALSHLENIRFLTGRDRWWQPVTWAEGVRAERDAWRLIQARLRAGVLDAMEFGDHADLNRALRRRVEAAGAAFHPLRVRDDIEHFLAPCCLHGHRCAGRGAWMRHLIDALDEVVPDWRHLPPVAPPVEADHGNDDNGINLIRHQSSAAGLSWLPLAGR